MGATNSLFAAGIYGVVKVVATAVFVFFCVESLGRKLSLIISSVGIYAYMNDRLLLLCHSRRKENLGWFEQFLPASDGLSLSVQWKKYLTTMQIVQFIIDLFIVYFGSEIQVGTLNAH